MTPTLNLLFELDENLSNLKVPKVVGHADQGRPYELSRIVQICNIYLLWQQGWTSLFFKLTAVISKRLDAPNN